VYEAELDLNRGQMKLEVVKDYQEILEGEVIGTKTFVSKVRMCSNQILTK
jgi:hypothetical protein